MNRIALIFPYWGKFPNYFQFFLECIRRNPMIDVLLFTDNKLDFDYPSNVHIHDMSFEQFKSKLQARFDFALTHLQSPYCLCDFRPAYGYCLQEYLDCYDFWGHCDCDLIFGDIRSILTDNILSRYDRLLTRGHLTLYRNDGSTNRAFMDICPEGRRNFKVVFQSPSGRVCAWDEWGGSARYWKENRSERLYDEIVFDDINVDHKQFIASQRREQDRLEKKTNLCYLYRNGVLLRLCVENACSVVAEPTLYAHSQKRSIAVECSNVNYNSYLIVPNRIIDYEDVTVDKLKWWGRRRIFYFASYKRRFRNLRAKIREHINIFGE